MKKSIFNVSMVLTFLVSLYIVVFQGFGFPNILDGVDLVLRILIAFSAQAIVIANLKPTWIRLIPTVIAAVIALWGVYFDWGNITFGMYFAYYCTFLVGCAFGWITVKFKI